MDHAPPMLLHRGRTARERTLRAWSVNAKASEADSLGPDMVVGAASAWEAQCLAAGRLGLEAADCFAVPA